MLASFKHKLALYFLLLAVVPLTAAFWGFGLVAKQAEERRVDARLHAELRAVEAAYRRAAPLGRARLLRELGRDAALVHGDRLVFVPRGRLAPRRPVTVSVGGDHFRALSTGPLAGRPTLQLALLAPADAIDADAATVRWQLLFVLLGGLVVLGAIATGEGRSIMRSVGELASAAQAIGRGRLDRRVPVRGRDEFAALARSFNSMADELRARLKELQLQKTRLQESLTRFGDLLTATHDVDQLLTMIASAAVEAANAEGAVLLGDDGAVVEVGSSAGDGKRYELPLATGDSRFGVVVLHGSDLGEADLAAARALVAQGAIALENARLHEEVERKAVSDGLTGLANRRHCEEQLAAEVTRSGRYGSPLAVILCDIDDFKAANDTHGHGFGDLVLQRFAAVLRELIRDVDVAGRWGGEEFLIVLPGTSLGGAVEAAERIREAFTSIDFGGARLTASFGVASLAAESDAQELVRSADRALYAAKRLGKNRVEAAAALV